MRFLIAFVLTVHAVAHLVGFVVPFRLMSSPEMPYRTTLLAGRIDVGDAGIRFVGVIWLILAVAFVAIAVGFVVRSAAAAPALPLAAAMSLVLCALQWPDAKFGVLVNVVLLVASPLIGAAVWRDASAASLRRLEDTSAGRGGVIRFGDLANLPSPVARYLRSSLRDGQPRVVRADFEQHAEFFVGSAWHPLTATQRFLVDPPGFVWDARIQVAPLASVYVRDSYIGGSGSMRGDFAAFFPIVNQHDRTELNAAALHRYLAEAVWLPTALLPSERLSWQGLDDRRAVATLVDGATRVSLEFTFDDRGDVQEMLARDRFREVNGRYEPTPWVIRCFEHGERDGMRIPLRCEVAWQLPSGPLPYWRGRITSARYVFG